MSKEVVLRETLSAVAAGGLGFWLGTRYLRHRINIAFSTFADLPKEQQTIEVQRTTVRAAAGFDTSYNGIDR